MDILKEDRALFRSGAVRPAFGWGLLLSVLILLVQGVSIPMMMWNLSLGLLFLLTVPVLVLFGVFYMALARGVERFALDTYSLRIEFLSFIAITFFISSLVLGTVLSGELMIPAFGLIPFLLLFVMPLVMSSAKERGAQQEGPNSLKEKRTKRKDASRLDKA